VFNIGLSQKVRSERIMKKFSEKVSNDKICNCIVIPCTLLLGYYLVPRYSESLAVPPFLNLEGRQEKIFVPQTVCQVSANVA